jgi:RNA polymerase primary sigma factor
MKGDEMRRVTATDRKRLQSVLESLANRLVGASIKRSASEDVVVAHGGADDLREQVEDALRAARIQVVEDEVVVVARRPEARAVGATSAHQDLCTVARARLARDRQRPSHRLAKTILSAEEEVGLMLLARPNAEPLAPGGFSTLTGEAREAAEAMLLHNMGLIHSVAQRLGGQGLEYDDLVASGVPGLVRAIELFEPRRGLKFSTYAMHWVRQSIGRAIDDEGRLIRLPVHVCESVRQVKAAQERLTVDGRPPRWDEIARDLGMPVKKVEQLLRLAPAVVSLETPLGVMSRDVVT